MKIYYYIPSFIKKEQIPDDYLFLDYDLNRLDNIKDRDVLCSELSDVNGKFNEIRINILDYIPKEQIDFDFCQASRKLNKEGICIVHIFNKKYKNSILQIIEKYFKEIKFHKKENIFLLKEPLISNCSFKYKTIKTSDIISKKNLCFKTRKGIFSPDKIDLATQILLKEKIDVNNKKNP